MAYNIMAAGANTMLKNLTTLKSTMKSNEKNGKSNLSFDQVMDQNQSVSSSQKTDSGKDKSVTTEKEANQQTVENKAVDTKTNTETSKDAVNQEKDISSTDSVDSVEQESTDVVNEALAKLKKSICEILNISEEELDDMLQQLGLTMFDLLQPENIQLLVMKNAGTTDPSVFLTDETVADAYTKILEVVDTQKEQLEQETGIPAQELIAAAKEKFITDTKPELKPETKDTKEKSDTKEIPVTVVSSNEEEKTVSNEENKKEFTSQDHSSKQPESKTAGEQFLQNLSNAFVKEAAPEQQLEQVTQIREITQQIVEQVKVVIRPEQTSMEMQLNPEHLGKVNLNITSKNGVMTAQFLTQTQVAKEAIESQVQILRETLEQQGLKVEAIEVNVSEYAFQKNGESAEKESQQQEKSKRRQILHIDDTTAQEEQEQIEQVVDLTGSNVNYTA